MPQERLAALEQEHAEVKSKYDDVASGIDRERLAKVGVGQQQKSPTEEAYSEQKSPEKEPY